jgi:uncharacterized protein
MASALLDKLLNDIKSAMKGGDREALTALRSLHAQIKDATTNQGREAADSDVASVVAKAIKQRQDAIEQFRQAARTDLVELEQRELELLRMYQPPQLTEAEIRAVAAEAVAAAGATTRKDMGKVMAVLMPQVKGRADGRLVNQVVQSLLPPDPA